MSDVYGNGYGDQHDWRRGETSSFKVTVYKCRRCGAPFAHAYDDIPDIFMAMKWQGVPETCTAETVSEVQK